MVLFVKVYDKLSEFSSLAYIINYFYVGEVGNQASSMCLTVAKDGFVALTYDCFLYSRLQEQVIIIFKHRFLLFGRMAGYKFCFICTKFAFKEA